MVQYQFPVFFCRNYVCIEEFFFRYYDWAPAFFTWMRCDEQSQLYSSTPGIVLIEFMRMRGHVWM